MVACISWAKRNSLSLGEREQTQTLDYILLFWCSSKMFVVRFRLHSWASCVSHFSELTTKRRPYFSSLFTSSWLVFNCYLSLVISSIQLTFKPESSAWCRRGGGISISSGSTPTQKIWDIQIFFLVIFDYHGHSPVTGWPATSALSCLTQPSCLFVDSLPTFSSLSLVLQKFTSRCSITLRDKYLIEFFVVNTILETIYICANKG